MAASTEPAAARPRQEQAIEPDLTEQYAVAYGGGLEPGDSLALLVVDLVAAYLAEGSPLFMEAAEGARAATEQLVNAARAASVPVIWTSVQYQPGGADGGRFYEKVPALKVFDADAQEGLGAFPPSPVPTDDETVVVKQFPSAFFGTGLAEDLRWAGVNTLLIAGYSTSGCVRASALDALCHGFVPLVVRDACADRDPRPHESNLFDLQAKYAEVISLSAALDVLGAERD